MTQKKEKIVMVAESAGFCFGVERAVRMVREEIARGTAPLYTYGPIIHNEEVVNELAAQGVRVIESEEELKSAEPGTIIIRSHGISRAQEEHLKALGFRIADATCPFVRKLHEIAQEASARGDTVFIIGDAAHPEVEAVCGWCENPPYVIGDETEIPQISPETPITVLSQTTFREEAFKKIVEKLNKRYYNVIVVNTICNATQKRQQEAEELAGQADAMIVIGGSQSSNTRKLVEICEAHCAKTYYIRTLANLLEQGFEPVSFVGITAGASTPKNIIEEVQNFVGSKF